MARHSVAALVGADGDSAVCIGSPGSRGRTGTPGRPLVAPGAGAGPLRWDAQLILSSACDDPGVPVLGRTESQAGLAALGRVSLERPAAGRPARVELFLVTAAPVVRSPGTLCLAGTRMVR